jgi:hypothetical protein
MMSMFGPETDAITGDWRKIHIEELHDLYTLPGIIWGFNLLKPSGNFAYHQV